MAAPRDEDEAPPVATRTPTPKRTVFEAEALAWLAANPAPADASVVTSLPDRTEIAGMSFESWRAWFVEAARQVTRWTSERGVVVFYQSDVRHRGQWVDKGHLVTGAAEAEGARMIWHKIVCRKPPGSVGHGRPSYSHMIAFSRHPHSPGSRPSPDVIPDAGHMPWSRAMGVLACEAACRYLLDDTDTRTVVDPFCGHGTVLAVANDLGLDAIGVDLSAKRCRTARAFTLPPSSASAP